MDAKFKQMKKHLLSLILIHLGVSVSHAQSPDRLSYQAVVRNSSGNPVVSQSVGSRMSILKGSATGSAVYVETQQATTTANGVLNLEIGSGKVESGSLSAIDWSQGPYFAKVETDPAGGTNYTVVGATQLLSVPYALFSKSTALRYSNSGDTLYSGNQFVIVPGISAANQAANGQGTATLTTTVATNIGETTATLGGQITNQGGSAVTTRGIVFALTGSPTIANSTVLSGTGTGSFQTNLTGLNSGTQYYARAFATNSFGTSYGNQVVFTTTGSNGANCTGKIKDIDGNEYNIVQIGNQCWIKENLRVTRFRNGDSIHIDKSGGARGDSTGQTWGTLSTPARTLYNHDANGLAFNGFLYNRFAAQDSRGICPIGWHLPSSNEYVSLANYLGGELVAGGKMKSTGTSLWKAPNEGADNSSGFSANPSGYRSVFGGSFLGKGEAAIFWTDTEGVSQINRELHYDSRVLRTPTLVTYNVNPPNGLSVRCIRD
jgi:uncharacterized protein (TIGR02145 family)